MIGTPGRLSDLLKKRTFNLKLCEMLVIDEAERLLESTFEEELLHLFRKIEVSLLMESVIYPIKKRQEDRRLYFPLH